jgi:uncharacterized SAM-binding protein YcdF (DUF218 family)
MRLRLLLILGAATLVVGFVVVSAAGRWLLVADPLPAAADAIVIMAGSVSDRSLEAADLYRSGLAPRVVVTRERLDHAGALLVAHGIILPEGDDRTHMVLTRLGVPDAAIVRLRRRTRSTMTEARTIARWACRHRIHELVVVTSRAHTRRAGLILRQSLGPGVHLTMRPSRYDTFTATRWWRVSTAAKQVLSEYEKLAHYWLAEQWRITPCGGLARARR